MKPWFPVLLFSVLIVLFLPSFLSSHPSRQRPAAIKGGWDALYFTLVLFAILCGFLGRRSSDSDSDNSSLASSSSAAAAAAAAISTSNPSIIAAGGRYDAGLAVVGSGGFADTLEANRTAAVHRMRSNGPNPDVKHGVAAVWGGGIGDSSAGGASSFDDWQHYDSAQLYRRRSESVGRESRSFWSPETPGFGSTLTPPPTYPSLPIPWTGSVEKFPGNLVDQGVIYGLENPPEASQKQRHRRWRTLEKLPAVEMKQDPHFTTEIHRQLPLEQEAAAFRHGSTRNHEEPPGTKVEQDSNFVPEMTFQATSRRRSSFDKIGVVDMTADFAPQMPRLSTLEQATSQRHRRRSPGKSQDMMEEEQDSKLKVEMPRPSPLEPTPAILRHRKRSLDKLPNVQAEQNAQFTWEMTHPSLPVPAMSSQHRNRSRDDMRKRLAEQEMILEQEKPSTLPPAPSSQEEAEVRRNHKKKNNGRAEEDIAAAMTEKKKKKKKKGSKTKRKQEEGTSPQHGATAGPPTPPPSPPPLLPAAPRPAMPSVIQQLFSRRGDSKSRRTQAPAAASAAPPQPPPPPSIRCHEKQVESSSSPQPPGHGHSEMQTGGTPPPLPPPSPAQVQHYKKKSPVSPHSPSPPRATRPALGHESELRQTISDDRSGEMKAGMSASCSSPDANSKFEQFIARFHANLQLERMNSIRAKQRRGPRKQQQQ